MEQALMAVCKDIRLGKILIQTNHDTGEPEVRERQTSVFLLCSLSHEVTVRTEVDLMIILRGRSLNMPAVVRDLSETF